MTAVRGRPGLSGSDLLVPVLVTITAGQARRLAVRIWSQWTAVSVNAREAPPRHAESQRRLLIPPLNLSPRLTPPPQLLEYAGKGKSIVDAGLAQARRPLTPRRHYCDLEIVDAGEKCYIALGLARRVSILAARHLTPEWGGFIGKTIV